MKQLFEQDDMIGRTITRVEHISSDFELLVFSDETFLLLTIGENDRGNALWVYRYDITMRPNFATLAIGLGMDKDGSIQEGLNERRIKTIAEYKEYDALVRYDVWKQLSKEFGHTMEAEDA